jgi:hypothetical protein
VAWLQAMVCKQSLRASFARASSAYLPTLLLGGCALAGLALGAALAALPLLPELASLLPHSPAAERAVTLASIAVFALTSLFVTTAHDLSRARLALGARLVPALRFAIRRAFGALVAQHALLAAAALGAMTCAELVTRSPPTLPAGLALGAQQLLVLGATLLRGTWLALALLASEPAQPLHPSGDGDLDPERVP